MFDPVSISASLAVASTAFNGIKKAFHAGRELESMSQDLSRWMGAVSDIDNIHKSAKNPSLLKKVMNGKSIEQEAIEAFTAKTQLEQQRNDLRTFIQYSHGQSAWNEILRLEGEIRNRRKKEVYDKQKFREKVITYVVLAMVLVVGVGVLGGFIFTLMGFDRGWWLSN
jgi:nitrate reductase NapE component